MVLRELIAIFGLEFDDKGAKDAEKAIGSLKQQTEELASALSGLFTATAVAAPFLVLTQMASNAQESLNLVDIAFEENGDAVLRWAEETSTAVGRSKFTLIDFVTQIGAVLRPLTGSADAASEMSTALAELGVDLASVFNRPEEDAIRAVLSAMTGETESIKRFGIVMKATALEAFALTQGIQGSVKDLGELELAQLRFNFIMSKGAVFLGDAAKTQFQFANSSRALRDAFKDLGTELGLFLLPGFEASINATRELLVPVQTAIRAFKDWAANTNLAVAAVAALGLILQGVLLPTLLRMLPFLAAFAAFAIILDDVITAFEGGDSVLLNLAKTMDKLEKEGFPGMSDGMAGIIWLFNRFRDVVGETVGVVSFGIQGLITGDFKDFSNAIQVIHDDFIGFLEGAGTAGEAVKVILNAITNLMILNGGLLVALVDSVSKGSTTPLRAFLLAAEGTARETLQEYKDLLGIEGSGAPLEQGATPAGVAPRETTPSAPFESSAARLAARGAAAFFSSFGGDGQMGGLVPLLQGLGAPNTQRFVGGGSGAPLGASLGQSSLDPAGLMSRGVTVQQGDQTFSFTVTQQAGENAEDFAQRVAEIVDQKGSEREETLFNSLVQTAGAQ